MSLTIQRPSIPVPLTMARGGTEATNPADARANLELGDLALLTAPGGTSTFLRADKTWVVPPSGGGGSTTLLGLTDVPDSYTGQATKVLAVRADETGTEFVTPASGGGAPSDAEFITSTGHASLSAERVLTDTATITWDRATAGQIKANVIGTSYTDEQAQDAIGAMLVDTATIDLTYNDATPALSASVIDGSIIEAKLGFSDLTTKDASTTAHGLLRKLSGTATQYLDGSGAWTTPAGAASSWSRTVPTPPSYLTGMLAWWRMEEASGNRVDSVSGQALVPQGTVAQITTAAGKTGQAVQFNATAGTYLTVADSPTLSVGTSSFSVACWVYFETNISGANWGLAGKGTAAAANAGAEWFFRLVSATFLFSIGNNTVATTVSTTGITPALNTWYFLVGWYDADVDIQYLQVNNGTVFQVANTHGAYDSAQGLDIGRLVGWAASPTMNGRVDNVMFAKRVWTTQERTDLYNGGAGVDYSTGAAPFLTPTTATDRLVLAAASTTQERLEVDGAIKVGNALGTTDGTLRWSGTDFEGRKAGAWVTLTAAAGQPLDATLTALAGLATGADQLPYATGTDTFAQTTLTPFARTLLDDTTQAAMQTTLALVPGTHVQAQDAELQAIAGLVSAADRLPYFTGLGTAALATFTAAGRTLAGAADAAAQRSALALGTMAQQDAANVVIAGGVASLTSLSAQSIAALDSTGDNKIALHSLINSAGGTNRWGLLLQGTAPSQFAGVVGVQATPLTYAALTLQWAKATQFGIYMRPSDTDTGNQALQFVNVAGTSVGDIVTTATATAYNTSSDVRLKHAITALTGALDVVQALRPVHFLWNATDEPGEGFLAHELMRHVPAAVTGEPDAVGPQGDIVPQGVDHSRLVPWLVGALQETLAQVQALTARVAALEHQLGI